jgi:alkaline phosphatase D
VSDRSRPHPSLPWFQFPDGELDSWFVLGDTTDRTVRVWARSPGGATEARLVIAGEEVARAAIEPDPQHDDVGVAVLEAGEPRPGVEFDVRLESQVRRGRFAPAATERAPFSFAFGSCHQPFSESLDESGRVDRLDGAAIYPRINRLLTERGASFAMWLGDQVYSDAVSEMSVREKLADDPTVSDQALLDTYRHLYRGFFNERGYRELAEALPAYLMWDDHDIFDGWGSLIDRTAFDERVYRAAEKAFVEYQHLRNPTGTLGSRPPFGYSFWRGDVGFHVPDLRGERDFEKGQILGAAGWKLLDDFLAEATDRDVPTVFIGASVPVVHASPAMMKALEGLNASPGRDVRDRWSVPTFEAERTKLVDRLFAWQSAKPKRQVIVLSGDVHVGAAFSVRPRMGRGHFHQWTSSALSTPDGLKHVLANRLITRFVRLGEHELRVWRKGLATSNNVGLVEVEPAEDGGHVVSLTVYEYNSGDDSLKIGLTDVASIKAA